MKTIHSICYCTSFLPILEHLCSSFVDIYDQYILLVMWIGFGFHWTKSSFTFTLVPHHDLSDFDPVLFDLALLVIFTRESSKKWCFLMDLIARKTVSLQKSQIRENEEYVLQYE